METNYPTRYRHLQNLIGELADRLPEPMQAFTHLHKAATSDGALSRKQKELIALAVAMTANCDGCIAFHVKDALSAGASREEIQEAIGVVVMMGGGQGVVYGCQALEALDQFEGERAEAARMPAL